MPAPPPTADHLPPPLREALLAELDPGETLRWCDQPVAPRAFRSAVPPALLFFVLVGIFAMFALGGAMSTLAELRDPTLPRLRGQDGMGTVIVLLILGVLLAVGALACLSLPWVARRKAGRTVYGLSDTRVFRLMRDRSGRVQMTVVEPGHPLSISRREYRDGSGDIALYPSAANRQHAQLMLLATPSPREVERLIRTTFDPPR